MTGQEDLFDGAAVSRCEQVSMTACPERENELHACGLTEYHKGDCLCDHCNRSFVPRQNVRATDPETSREAAQRAMQPRKLRNSHREVLTLYIRHGNLTDEHLLEIAMQANVKQSPSGLRTRRKELVDMGRVERKGRTKTHAIWGLV